MQRIIIACFLALFTLTSHAQVSGKVTDAKTRESLDFVSVYYDGKNVGTETDENGLFAIKEDSAWHELSFYLKGYETQVIKLAPYGNNKNLKIKLKQDSHALANVTVTAKRRKYSRKNNPAVELMKKVIEHKRMTDLRQKDYYSYTKYEKMTFSLNEVTEKVFDQEDGKTFGFLKEHVTKCPETGKYILPLTVQETVSENYFRKDPRSEKKLIKAISEKGINELLNTGDIITSLLKEVFTDVDIYKNECRLLQFPFKSPIADNAISFYRYYLQDTIRIENDSVIDVGFLPNNPQDFGFSGHLYILKDSTYAVRRVELNIPSRSDVNFVDNMIIKQEFVCLPSGERVCTTNDMLIEMKYVDWLQKLLVQRTIRNTDYSFAEVPAEVIKKIKGNEKVEAGAGKKDEKYWSQYRQVELTESEGKMGSFLDRLRSIKGFGWVMFAAKALIENYIETSATTETNKFDYGPVNTTISYNHYDRLRYRASGFTTANLMPRFFVDAYVAVAPHSKLHDTSVYGMLKTTYSFNDKKYLYSEFPKKNIYFMYTNDIIDPYTKFMTTDKDNVFMAFKSSKVDQFYHTREHKLALDFEWENGMQFYAHYSHTKNTAVDKLFFQTMDKGEYIDFDGQQIYQPNTENLNTFGNMTTSEIKTMFTFMPGANYTNTKKRRWQLNKDVPIIFLSHTTGIKGLLGGQYNYNVTEAGVHKRFWLGTWGKIDTDLKAGIQWNKVPYPLLIHPVANNSFILQSYNFNLIQTWEFLNDRYASLFVNWDMNGKIFNRIPLLKELKWREWIGINCLWGQLTDKNNPKLEKNYGDPELMFFPGHFNGDGIFENNTQTMDYKMPYVEAVVGIHNIFKLIHIVYVRRLTYTGKKWGNPNVNGVRFIFRMSF